jgi:hypothetical protein
MTTEVLELGEFFDVRDLAEKAREAASMFDGGEEVRDEERTVLLVLNAGLANFLTGEYKAEEPEGTTGEEAVTAWVEFAHDIAHSYERLSDEGYTTFHEEDNVGNVLQEQAEEHELFKKVPHYIENAVNWQRVEEYIKSTGTLAEMYIDGETYVSNVYLVF